MSSSLRWGHWTVYCTSPQRFLVGWIINFGDLPYIMIGWLSVQTTDFNLQTGLFCVSPFGDVDQFIDHCLIPLDTCGTQKDKFYGCSDIINKYRNVLDIDRLNVFQKNE